MAVTKIWAVKDSLQRVPDYAANPDKTEYGGLAQALHYATDEGKTASQESVHFVTGIHCRADRAWADMRAVQERFGKTDKTVALHAYQSFRPGEVTPEQCHAIGVELARRVWGGRFQVLVATHLNTDCPHNHFVINSVSYVDGKKYEQRRSQYAELRAASDALCREYRLSVIEHPGGKTPRPLYEAERHGEPTRYNQMRAALRLAMRQASTEQDFARILLAQGFHWQRNPRRKYATLQAVDKVERPKPEKYLAGYYTAEEMERLFEAARGHRLELVIQFAAFYGLRRGEVLGLRWEAIDFAAGTLTIRHIVTSANLDGRHILVEADRAKTKSSLRTLPLVAAFAERLRELKARQAYSRQLCGNCYNTQYDGYVFVDEMGNLFLPNSVTDGFAKLLADHGLRKIRFHDLHHSCASLLLKQGVPMKQIQEWLGHSDISTTANIYAHLDSQSKVLSAATMEQALPLPESGMTNRWQT